jgi:hypothetical protein
VACLAVRCVQKGFDAVQPDRTYGSSGLDQTEATADGTALIGNFESHTRHLSSPEEREALARKIGEEWNQISSRLAELYATGVPSDDPRAQEVIQQHYNWLRYFWTPDRDSYLRLAEVYANQPKFRKRIERRKPKGLAGYLRDAMTTYAWGRLS